MTLPEPRGPGPSERRGPRRPPSRPSRGRPSACRRRRRLFLPSRLSPRVCERARGGPVFSRRSRSPPPPPLVRGRPPSRLSRRARWRGVSSPARPVPGLPTPPGAGPGSSRSPRRCASLPRVGGARRGPAPALERPARGRRLGTAAWSVGAVRRAGARPSRGGSAVPGGWPLPVPATRRPPPALLSRSSVRVPPSAARSPRRCVGGSPGIPVVPSGGRRPRFSSLSPPACSASLRSLAPARLGLARF